MKKVFYEIGSDEYYLKSKFWIDERSLIKEEGGTLLSREEANQLKITSFFDKNDGDIKPKLNQNYELFALPYEVDDEFKIEGVKLEEFIISMINTYLPGTKYLASTDRDKCCVIKCQKFNSKIYWGIDVVHINTPFIIFDEKKQFFILLDYDLPIQVVGYKNSIVDKKLVDRLKKVFHNEWPNILNGYQDYINLIPFSKKYYSYLFYPYSETNLL